MIFVFLSGEHNSVPLTGTQNLAFPSEEQKGESCVPLTGTQNGLCSSQGNTTPPLNKSIYIDKESNSSFSRKEKTRPRKRTRGEEDQGVLAVWNDVLSLVDGDEDAAGSILLLKNHFCEVTGIAGPPIDIRAERRRLGDEWWPYLKHYLDAAGGDLDLAKLAVEKGAEELTKFKRGSVCAPKSLRNKVPALIPTLRQVAVVEEELTGLRFY